MKKKILLIWMIILAGFVGVPRSITADDMMDYGIYAELLSTYVDNGVVNYQGFKSQESKLDAFLKNLESAKSEKMSRNEQFAFYINAYNAWTIKLILSGYPGIKSIKDLGTLFTTPWDKKICRIDGKVLTLNDIEHKILRPKFKDPRVHFAIVCASKGCPKLISDPYQGKILDSQLDEAARSFVNNWEQNYLDGNTLYVSSIFKWFSEDFNNDILSFFIKYATNDLKKQLGAKSGDIKIQHLDYDWSLNGY
jgi:hypothetical protein